MDKSINLSCSAFGSCIIGSFIYILPRICKNPIQGFGVIASFSMFIAGIFTGVISGITLGFLIWLLFRVSKSAIYRIHYVLVSLIGVFIGFWFIRFIDKAGVFLR